MIVLRVCVSLVLLTMMVSWILYAIRVGRLYVGYGAVFLCELVGICALVVLPGMMSFANHLLDLALPGLRVTHICLGILFLTVVYFAIQLTVISNRLATLVQMLAVEAVAERRLDRDQETASSHGSGELAPGV